MTILDIFSWLPAKEMSLDEIQRIVLALKNGNMNIDGFELKMEIPSDANENVVEVTNDLISEGKKVCYLLRAGEVIAAIGYREKSSSGREITEYDGYKIYPKRLSENASEEEKQAYQEEKALAKQKSEEILQRLRLKDKQR